MFPFDGSPPPEVMPCSQPSLAVLRPLVPSPRVPSVIPESLPGSLQVSCCLLLGPAGSGKTQYLLRAMQEWSARESCAPLWLPLQPGYATPLQLLQMLGKANGQRVTEWPLPCDPLASLREWLLAVEQHGQRMLVCLDDIQRLQDPGSWQWLLTLVEQRPSNLTLLVAGREAPLPLGRWNLLPEWQFLLAQQGHFSRVEQQDWLVRQGVTLDEELAESLWEAFAGWPAALVIWLGCYRAAGRQTPGEQNPGPQLGRRALEDYWRGEVICDVPDDARQLLGLLTHLPGLSTDALGYLLERDAVPLIQCLVQKNLLYWSGSQYAIYPCYQWLLRGMSTDAEQRGWHQKAFQWFSQQNLPVLALQHARLGNDLEALVPWVESHAETILASLDFSGLVRWCELAGDELLAGSSRLMQIACWAWLLTWRPRKAEAMLRQLQQRQGLREAEMMALQGYLARLRGQQRTAVSCCRKAWQHLPERRAAVRFLMANSLAYACLGETDLDMARRWNQHSLDIARAFDKPALEALACFELARVELHRGQVSEAQQLLERGLLICQQPGLEDSMAMGRLLLYRAFLRWMRNESADVLLPDLEKGIQVACRHGDVLVCYGYGLLAMQTAAAGDWQTALAHLEAADSLMRQWGVDRDSYRWLLLVQANVWLACGHFQRARDCLADLLQGQSLQQLPRADVFPMLPDFAAATLARLHLLVGNYDQCLFEIDEWLRCNSSPIVMVLVQLMRAAALRGCQQTDESMAVFSQISGQMHLLGIPRVFAGWLPEVHEPVVPVDEVRPLVRRVQLSEREHDVLRKIAEGLSNEEVARQLFISLHTVKSHARRINVKLGVRNRTQAIHRAREMLLL